MTTLMIKAATSPYKNAQTSGHCVLKNVIATANVTTSMLLGLLWCFAALAVGYLLFIQWFVAAQGLLLIACAVSLYVAAFALPTPSKRYSQSMSYEA